MNTPSASVPEQKTLVVTYRENEAFRDHVSEVLQRLATDTLAVRTKAFAATDTYDVIKSWMSAHPFALYGDALLADETCLEAARETKTQRPGNRTSLDVLFNVAVQEAMDAKGIHENSHGNLFDPNTPHVERLHEEVYAKVFSEVFARRPNARAMIATNNIIDHTVYSRLVHEAEGEDTKNELRRECEDKMTSLLQRALATAGVAPDRISVVAIPLMRGYTEMMNTLTKDTVLIIDRHNGPKISHAQRMGATVLRAPVTSLVLAAVNEGHMQLPFDAEQFRDQIAASIRRTLGL